MEENNPQVTSFKVHHLKREIIRDDYTKSSQLNIKGYQRMHRLGFEFYFGSINYKPLDPHRFFKPLEKVKYINGLHVHIYQTGQHEIIAKDFSEKLRSLSSLRSLNLNFGSASWLSLEGIAHLSNAFGDLKRLSKLTLSFYNCRQLDDECFDVLFQSIKKHHKNLRSFGLDVSSTNITEKTFENLSSVLKHSLKSLEEFSLTSHNSKMSGNALEFLASGLAHLVRLKKLRIPSLVVQNAQETAHSLISSIKNLKSLQVLDLNLPLLIKNTAKLEILVTSLQSFSDLRSLILNFQQTEKFSLQEMEILTQSFQFFPFLEHLALDFRNCLYIDDQALEKLSASLGIFTKLSKIALSFDQCSKVGDAGVESLVSQLIDLKNLNVIILSFLNCSPIKNEHYDRLQMNKNNCKISFQYKKICELLVVLRADCDLDKNGRKQFRQKYVSFLTQKNPLFYSDLRNIPSFIIYSLTDQFPILIKK